MKKLLVRSAIVLLAMVPGVLMAEQDDSFIAPTEALSEAEALATWEKAYEVFSHPRCANCHVPEDNRPRWSGPNYGDGPGGQGWRFHGMNVHADESRFGVETLACTTCHGLQNSDQPHGPPGAPAWMLAPVEMVWWQKSSAEICEQIKDPERNGGRTLEEVADHISHDDFVAWGWNPGPGREVPPYSALELSAYVTAWATAGAPCPTGDSSP